MHFLMSFGCTSFFMTWCLSLSRNFPAGCAEGAVNMSDSDASVVVPIQPHEQDEPDEVRPVVADALDADAAAVEPGLQAQPQQQPQPQPQQQPQPVLPQVPYDTLFPRSGRVEYRDAIVNYALPHLVPLIRDPANRLASPRDLVAKALDLCERAGDKFWGQHFVYTRRRSAADAIICHYFGTLQDFVAGRAVAP